MGWIDVLVTVVYLVLIVTLGCSAGYISRRRGGGEAKDYFLAGLAARMCGKKNVLRLGIVREMRGLYHRLLYGRWADGIIVNARGIKEVLMQTSWCQDSQVRVIYNGLDLDTLEEAISQETIPKPFAFTVSSMGRVTRRKGFDDILHGFAHFVSLSQAKDVGLVIIGDGNDLEDLKRLSKEFLN